MRLEGERVIRLVEGKSTFLVDPEETIPLDSIETPEYVVVRKRQIIRRRPFRTETTEVADLQQFLPDPLRIDGPGLRRFERQWGLALLLGFSLAVLMFALLGEVLAGALYTLVGAGIAHGVRGRRLGLVFGSSLRVALAAYSVAIVLDAGLVFFGLSPGACMGLWIWSSLVSALAVWRVGR